MDSAATFCVTSKHSPRNESTSQCESSGIAMPVGMALPNHQWHGEKARTKTAAKVVLPEGLSAPGAPETGQTPAPSWRPGSYLCQRLGADPSHIHKESSMKYFSLLWLTSHLHLCLTQCKLSKTAGWDFRVHQIRKRTTWIIHPDSDRFLSKRAGVQGPRLSKALPRVPRSI